MKSNSFLVCSQRASQNEFLQSSEIMDYSCDICKKRTVANSETKFVRLPQTLLINFKSYSYDELNGPVKKIHR